MPIDVLGPLTGLAERFFGGRERRRATDMRIADKARALRRMLAASFEDWEGGPRSLEELVRWALKLASAFPNTEPALAALVDLRPDASVTVRKAVGAARDQYYEMADLIPLIPAAINPVLKRQWETTEAAAAERLFRRAWAHMRPCLVALDRLTLD